MIAKYSGACYACGGLIVAGTSCDYERSKGIRHFNCPDKAAETQGQLADRLGYRHYSWDELQRIPAPGHSVPGESTILQMGVTAPEGAG